MGSGIAPIAMCTLPSDSQVNFNSFSFYTVDADDPDPLNDTATLLWNDVCDGISTNCSTTDQSSTAPGSSPLQTVTPTDTATPTQTDTPTPTDTTMPTPTNTPTVTPTDTPTVGTGCTPGFWKNHTDVWVTYDTEDVVGDVFDEAFGAPADSTLLEALSFGGGPGVLGAEQILLRAAVAALLNSTGLSGYPLTTQEVIDQVNAALASDDRATMLALATTLDGFNNADCTLN